MTEENRKIFAEIYKVYERFETPPPADAHPEERVAYWEGLSDALTVHWHAGNPLAEALANAVVDALISRARRTRWTEERGQPS